MYTVPDDEGARMTDPSRIIIGDVIDGLRTLDAGSVQCCVTSPPYWGLRSYLPDGVVLRHDTPQYVLDELARLGIMPVDHTSR